MPPSPPPPLRALLLVYLLFAGGTRAAGPVISRAYVLPKAVALAPQNAAQFVAQAPAVVVPGVNSQTVSLVVGAAGGDLVALEGSGFGASAAAGSCAFTPWALRATPLASLACDSMESFLGEGEVSRAQIAFWNDSLVVFAVNPGLGSKQVTLTALNIPVTASAATSVSLAYRGPSLLAISPPSGDAEGGTTITLSGADFGPAARDMRVASNRISSFPVPLAIAPSLPLAVFVVFFDSFACVAMAFTASGFPSEKTAQVLWGSAANGGLIPIVALSRCSLGIQSQNDSQVTIWLPPGVGANHNITVGVVDGPTSQPLGALRFSYNPPSVASFVPTTIPASSAGAQMHFVVHGSGFGSVWPGQFWPRWMETIAVSVGGAPCQVSRVRTGSNNGGSPATVLYVDSCTTAAVGWQSFSVEVAGQAQTVTNALCFDNAAATACLSPPPTPTAQASSSFAPTPTPTPMPPTTGSAAPAPSASAAPQIGAEGTRHTSADGGDRTAAAAFGATAAALLVAAAVVMARRHYFNRAHSVFSRGSGAGGGQGVGEVVNPAFETLGARGPAKAAAAATMTAAVVGRLVNGQ